MANSFYYTDGAGSDHTLFVGDGTDTQLLVLGGSESGEGEPAVEIASEKTPDKYADQYRGISYKPREYGFRVLVKRDTAANLESSLSTLRGYLNRELGEGHVKRVTPGAVTRELDCVPLRVEYARGDKNGPASREVEIAFLAHNPWWRSETATTVNTNIRGSVTISNPGFETGGTGGNFNAGAEVDDGTSDTFTDWTVSKNDGAGDKCEATATKHAGSYAVKLTNTAGQSTIKTANLTVTGGSAMSLTFWARGDGSVAGQYLVYDVTNAADIVAALSTGVTAATYAQVTKTFTVPATCVSLYIQFLAPAAAGVAYVDDVALAYTTTCAPCANTGQIPSWPVITITGAVNTPVITNSSGDSITVNYTCPNADDTLTIDCRPNGTYRRSVYYREHGTGTRTYKTISSASKYVTLPTGTTNLSLTDTAGAATVAVVYYLYYGGLY